MKIIQALGWYFPDHLGGTEVYVNELSRRLRNAGHEILVAAPSIEATSEQHYIHDGTPVYRFPVPRTSSRDESQGRARVRGTDRFYAWFVQQKPHWVHFHSFSSGLSLFELEFARERGVRAIATNHLASLGFICQRGTLMRWGEYLCDGISKPVKCAECLLQDRGVFKTVARIVARATTALHFHSLTGRVGSAISMPELIRHNLRRQKRMLELVEKFVVLNEWAANALIANGAPPEKVVLNRLGVSKCDLRKTGPGAHPTKLPVKIGYFGRMTALKGVVNLAKAFAQLPLALPITLEFRGPIVGPHEKALVSQLKNILRGDPRVSFCGQVSPDDAARILAGYDALCIPSIWFENGPTVMLEALAVGTPVIGTTIGAMPEVISHGINGWLVEPGDIEALADALRGVAKDPSGTIDHWRQTLPPIRTMDDVALDYLKLYETPTR
jgi:glycosyltransferase involved in cell wall biosynthesis